MSVQSISFSMLLVPLGLLIVFFLVLQHRQSIVNENCACNEQLQANPVDQMVSDLHQATDDRRVLSRRLNTLMKDHNLLKCKMKDYIADTGAWCLTASKNNHVTDNQLASTIAKMLAGKTIASFGDGPGAYKKLMDASGLVKTYDAYDGAPSSEENTNGSVRHLDLSVPQYGLPLYEWIMSLEVAEHLPADYESIYLDNILRHTSEGLIISWAIPGQGGYGHLNLRSMDYVKKAITSTNCFIFDAEKTKVLKKASTVPWLKQNVLVFTRNNHCPALEKNA